MTQPTPYTRQYAFLDWSASFPTTPHSGQHLDTEFNAVKTTMDQVLVNMAILQRDDGALHNGIVGVEALDSEVLTLMGDWNPRGAWVTATVYAAKDLATQGGQTYVSLIAHTAGVFATDLAANKWMALSSPGILANGGSTITADIPFNAHKITGLANGVGNQDAVTVIQVATALAALPATLSLASTAEINAANSAKAMPADQFAASKYNPLGSHMIPVEPGAFILSTTNGAVRAQVEESTSKHNYFGVTFSNSVQQFACGEFAWPKAAGTGTVTFEYECRHGTGSGNVEFALEAVGVGSGDTEDVTYGAAVSVIVALSTTAQKYKSARSAAVTIKNLAAEDTVKWRLKRVITTSGNIAQPVVITKLRIFCTTVAGTDA